MSSEAFQILLNQSNTSLDDYLEIALGKKHLPFHLAIPLTIVYLIIFISGIIGNVIVCLVIHRHSSMQTATNFHLFSLAISDLILLIFGLPYDLKAYWQQYPWMLGEFLCKIRAFVAEMSSYSSILVIVAFSIERYMAICHPLSSYSMSGLRRSLKIIVFVWLTSCLAAIPFAILTQIHYVDYPPGSKNYIQESGFCAMLNESIPTYLPLYEISAFVFFFIPMIFLAFCYIRIGFAICLRGRKSNSNRDSSFHDSKMHSSRISIVRMLASVVLAFFICWAPFHTQRLFYVYGKDSDIFRSLNEQMYLIAGVFYYISATINPILYNLLSEKYRNCFRQILCECNPKEETPALKVSSFKISSLLASKRKDRYSHNIENAVTTVIEMKR